MIHEPDKKTKNITNLKIIDFFRKNRTRIHYHNK